MTSPAPNLTAGFRAPMKPVRSSILYHAALVVTSLVMLLLPLVYIALIALTAFGLFWHATRNAAIFEHTRGGAMKFALLAYVGPLLAGAVGIAFMIKPLFAPRAERPEPYSLDPAQEPILFGFVEVLCRVMGAPVPRRIDVTCEPNASASFRRGVISLLGRGDVALAIGLPLVAGMDLRQLTGVLAHEFGHFTQGAGMRATYVIGRINGWFARVAYDRDSWDEALEEWASESNIAIISLLVLMCRLFVYLTRLILRALMHVAHAISCFMSRQMEYDADLHELRVSGSDCFDPTFRRILEIGASFGPALSTARERWRERRLPDDLPSLTLSIERTMPADVRARIRDAALQQKVRLFSTHPTLRQRLAHAQRAAEPGIFHLDAPATALFRNFQDVCRRASYLHYRAVLGEDIFNVTFVPTGSVVGEQRAQGEALQALRDFMGGAALSILPVAPASNAPSDPRALVARLKDARRRMAERQVEADAAAKSFDAADDDLIRTHQALTLIGAGMKFMPGPLKLASAGQDSVKAREQAARADLDRAKSVLEPFLADAADRLAAALAVLHVPGAAAKIASLGQKQAHAAALSTAARAIADAMPLACANRADLAALATVLQNLRQQKDQTGGSACAKRLGRQVAERVRSSRERLAGAHYPFATDAPAMSLADYVAPEVPHADDLGQVYSAAGQAIERLVSVYFRTLSSLAALAHEAEAAVGLGKRTTGSADPPTGTSHPPPG